MRLALRNGAANPDVFASQLGLAAASIRSGHFATELEQLAGLPAQTLVRFAPNASAVSRIVELCGEKLKLGDWTTKTRRVCALCLREDRKNAIALGIEASWLQYHRAYWDVQSIGTCIEHQVPLISSCTACGSSLGWSDPAISACRNSCDLSVLAAEGRSSSFDLYLAARLGFGGSITSEHLDALEFRHCVRFCELVGLISLIGFKPRLPRRSATISRLAREIGFQTSANFTREFPKLLDQHMSPLDPRRPSPGLIKTYGWVYSYWAADPSPVARPILGLLRTHAVERGVIAEGEVVLGHDQSEVLSIAQLRSETGWGFERSRALLTKSEALPRGTRRGVKAAIAVQTANKVRAYQAEMQHVGSRQIGRALGVGRGCARELVLLGCISSSNGQVLIRDVDKFVGALRGRCLMEAPEKCVVPIREAAAKRNVRLAYIVRAVLEGNLVAYLHRSPPVARLADQILIDPSKIPVDDCSPIPVASAAKMLGLHPEAVSQLVDAGQIQRDNGRGLCVESVASFDRRFVALSVLAKRRKTSSKSLKAQLEVRDVQATFSPPEFRQVIFERSVLADLI